MPKQKNFRGLGRPRKFSPEDESRRLDPPSILITYDRYPNGDLVRHLDTSTVRHAFGDHLGHLTARRHLHLARPRFRLANHDAFLVGLRHRLAFRYGDLVGLDLFPSLGHAYGVGLLHFLVFGDRNLASANLLTGDRNADRIGSRFRPHGAHSNRVVFRPLLLNGFGNSNGVRLLHVTAFRDRNLLGPDFLPRSRDPNGVVPRLRLHNAGADSVIFRPLFGNAFRDANRIALLDLTALGDGNLPSPDLFTS